MKNRVHITNTKFHVDEASKVVVCTMKVSMQLSKHPAWPMMFYEAWRKKFPHVDQMGRFEIKAVARCNSTDTFDVDTGKRIAESRAKSKAFLKAAKVYDCIEEYLQRQVELVVLSINACLIAKEIEDSHIKELIG